LSGQHKSPVCFASTPFFKGGIFSLLSYPVLLLVGRAVLPALSSVKSPFEKGGLAYGFLQIFSHHKIHTPSASQTPLSRGDLIKFAELISPLEREEHLAVLFKNRGRYFLKN